MKRENGTGSIIKRKDKKNRPYLVRVPANYTADGVSRTILGNYRTLKEAKEALQNYLIESRDHPTDYPNMTFTEAFERWSKPVFQTLSKSSIDGYNASYKKCESLYDMRLKDIKTDHLQSVIDRHSDLSSSSLTKLKVFLGQVLDYGIQEDVINKNYSSFVVLPKKDKQEKEFFTDLEIDKIAKSIGLVPYADYILAMIYTGFRVGEFLELTRFSYDKINHTLTGGSKTEAGRNRIVPLNKTVIPIVEKQLSRNGTTLFCNLETGGEITPSYFRKYCYYPALESIGVRGLNPHCTRHTFASLLAASGVKAEYAKKILGHSKYSTTAEVYIHSDTDKLTEEIKKLPMKSIS